MRFSERDRERIFSELINLCLDVVFTHGPQLFVQLGRDLMEAEVFHSLRGENRAVGIMITAQLLFADRGIQRVCLDTW